jgi:hypothetical protein
MRAAFSLRYPGWLSRTLLAWTLLLAPLAATQAQKPNDPAGKPNTLDTTWITPQSVAVGYVRPQQVLTAKGGELLPHEIFNAAAKKYLGIEAVAIESIMFVAEPFQDGQQLMAIVIKSTKPITLEKLSPEITGHTERAELNGVSYLKSKSTPRESYYVHEGATLIIGNEPMLQQLLQQAKEPATGPLVAALSKRPATDDLYVAVDIKTLRPQIEEGLAEGARDVPPQFQKYFGAIDLVRSAEFAFNLSQPKPPLLNVYANDENAATELAQLIDEAKAEAREQINANMQANLSDDPIQRAMAAYGVRRSEATLEMLKPVIDGNKLTFFPADANDPNQGAAQMQKIAVIGILVALLLPAVQAAREAARRNTSINNLKQLMLALHNYHDTKGAFPAHANYSDDGKPLLSWRVHILPFIEEQALYEQFHLDEPWDSEHNKQLIAQMPEVYLCPSSRLRREEGKTTFLAPVGENLIFDGTKEGARIKTILDGTSKTIALVDAADDRAVIWTKPDDLAYNPEEPLAGLAGGHHAAIFNAAWADGSVRAVSLDIDLDTLRALFTKDGGEVIGNDF